MKQTQFPQWMDEIIRREPACTVGTGPTDFKQAQLIFQQYGLQLEGPLLPYSPPYGSVIFVHDPDGTIRGAAVIKRFDEEAAEVRMAFLDYGLRGLHYAWPLLSAAIKLARGLGYQALTTGNLVEDDPKNRMGVFYHENGFNMFPWHRPRSIFDEGSYLELAL